MNSSDSKKTITHMMQMEAIKDYQVWRWISGFAAVSVDINKSKTPSELHSSFFWIRLRGILKEVPAYLQRNLERQKNESLTQIGPGNSATAVARLTPLIDKLLEIKSLFSDDEIRFIEHERILSSHVHATAYWPIAVSGDQVHIRDTIKDTKTGDYAIEEGQMLFYRILSQSKGRNGVEQYAQIHIDFNERVFPHVHDLFSLSRFLNFEFLQLDANALFADISFPNVNLLKTELAAEKEQTLKNRQKRARKKNKNQR